MKPRITIPIILAIIIVSAACSATNTASDVGKWWYTEVPQGYTEQGTAINPAPVGSPLGTVGGGNTNSTNNSNAPSSGKR